jgi:hypothetical protein
MELLSIHRFIDELNVATKLHIEWVGITLNSRNLRAMPRHNLENIDCILSLDSHKTCDFGKWFREHRESFEKVDGYRTHQLKRDHYHMHEAARIYYGNPERNAAYYSRLISKQEEIVDHLSYFKSESRCLLKHYFMS